MMAAKAFVARGLWYRVRFLLALCAILCLVIAYVRHGYRRREAVWCEYISAQFIEVYLMLVGYNDTFGHLPRPDIVDGSGEPLSSWRLEVLRFGEDTPVNWHTVDPRKGWRTYLPIEAQSPVDYSLEAYHETRKPFFDTKIVAIKGPGSAFDAENLRDLRLIEADTILLVETNDSGFHWMEPGDLDCRHVHDATNAAAGAAMISGNCSRGFHVCFADGTVWLMEHTTPLQVLGKFFTVDGAKKNDRDDVLGPYRVSEARGP